METDQSYEVSVSIDQSNFKRHGQSALQPKHQRGTALANKMKQLPQFQRPRPADIVPVEEIQIVKSEEKQLRPAYTATIMHEDDVGVKSFMAQPRRQQEVVKQ